MEAGGEGVKLIKKSKEQAGLVSGGKAWREDYCENVLNFCSQQAKVYVSQKQDVNLTDQTLFKKTKVIPIKNEPV